MKQPNDESMAEDMMDTSAENDEGGADDTSWLEEFVNRLTPDEVTQLKTLLDNKSKEASPTDSSGSPPPYDKFKDVSGTR